MKPLGRLIDHVWRVKRMGRATDLDMGSAFDSGVLCQQDWAEIVQTCRGCSWAPRCDDWLARHDGAPCAPSTCLNRARFEELRSRQAAP